MSKPVELPRWATALANPSDIVDPLSGKKDIGWQDSELPPHSYMNWLFNLIYLWTVYLDGLTDEALTWTAAHIFQHGITVTQSAAAVAVAVTAHTGQKAIDATSNNTDFTAAFTNSNAAGGGVSGSGAIGVKGTGEAHGTSGMTNGAAVGNFSGVAGTTGARLAHVGGSVFDGPNFGASLGGIGRASAASAWTAGLLGISEDGSGITSGYFGLESVGVWGQGPESQFGAGGSLDAEGYSGNRSGAGGFFRGGDSEAVDLTRGGLGAFGYGGDGVAGFRTQGGSGGFFRGGYLFGHGSDALGGIGAEIFGGDVNELGGAETSTNGLAGVGAVVRGGNINADTHNRRGGDALRISGGLGQLGYGKAIWVEHGETFINDDFVVASGNHEIQGSTLLLNAPTEMGGVLTLDINNTSPAKNEVAANQIVKAAGLIQFNSTASPSISKCFGLSGASISGNILTLTFSHAFANGNYGFSVIGQTNGQAEKWYITSQGTTTVTLELRDDATFTLQAIGGGGYNLKVMSFIIVGEQA